MLRVQRLMLWKLQMYTVSFSTEHYQRYKQSCTDLRQLPIEESKAFIQNLQAVLSDADGVLWLNNRAIEDSPAAFNKLMQLTHRNTFICTNNSTRTRQSLMLKAKHLGYEIGVDNIISSSHALAIYLKNLGFKKRAYVIGREGLIQELASVGIAHSDIGPYNMLGTVEDLMHSITFDDDVGAVIVGFDEHISFPKLTKACTYLMQPDCLLLATNLDEKYPAGKMILPATGCIVRAVEASAERPAKVIGKPNPEFCAELFQKNLIKPQTTLMIGDRGNTDMLFGYNCGFFTLLVGTGTNNLRDVDHWRKANNMELLKQVPDFFLPRLGDLIDILNEL